MRLNDRDELSLLLRALLADRTAPETRALCLSLAPSIHQRIASHIQHRYPDLLAAPDEEELVEEVLMELLTNGLRNFRGGTVPELVAYVRRIADCAVWKRATRRRRERDALAGEVGEIVRSWSSAAPEVEESLRHLPACPLSSTDEAYLLELLRAGSRADFARRQGVSRAAVTQRVQRIRDRIEALSPLDRASAEAWLLHAADVAIRQRAEQTPIDARAR
jgi:hypothetical protein